MSSINELLECAGWIENRLTTAAGPGNIEALISGAFLGQIPDEMPLPAVRFTSVIPMDIRGAANSSQRIMTQIDWMIVVVTTGLAVAPLVPLANALDQRLDKANGATASVSVLSCVRMYPFHLLERTDTGEHFRHAGGVYRTIVQAL